MKKKLFYIIKYTFYLLLLILIYKYHHDISEALFGDVFNYFGFK